jgi:hypothetical protein
MFKKTIFLLTVVCFLSISVIAFAQQKQATKPAPTFKDRLDSAGLKLNAIDSIITKIEQRKLITVGDDESFEKGLKDYAENTFAALEIAFKDARLFGDTEGKQGTIATLKTFEDTIKAQEPKIRQIQDKIPTIQAQIRTGAVKLDKPLIQQMTPADRDEFKKYVVPEASKDLEKAYPDLFPEKKSEIPEPGKKFELSLNLDEVNQFAQKVEDFCSSIPEEIGNLFVSKAEASVAIGCVAVCTADVSKAACAACVLMGSAAAVDAYNYFNKKYKGCCGCKWYKPNCCACKAYYIAVFLATLG